VDSAGSGPETHRCRRWGWRWPAEERPPRSPDSHLPIHWSRWFTVFGMTRARLMSIAYAAAGVLALAGSVAVGLLKLHNISPGQFDPVAAVIGLMSLWAGLGSLVLSVRARRLQRTDLTYAVQCLAARVASSEQQARRQLLGDDGTAIDVSFTLRSSRARDPYIILR
jgi:hypothetical protein